jgi:uncharacterized damage-inducible protein DinB
MTPAITLEELLAWNQESSNFWKAHLEANPALLELPCDIGGTANVLEFAGHIWGVELVWGQRIAGLPQLTREDVHVLSLDALFELHVKAVQVFRTLLDDPALNWDKTMTLDYNWLPPQARTFSRRKVAAHALFHSQRHWAQLATLVRAAGFPSGFKGDLLLSSALVYTPAQDWARESAPPRERALAVASAAGSMCGTAPVFPGWA